jgi:predicted PhzF superfamily epimerase YddE/YHI9
VSKVSLIRVFVRGARGGNPVPLVADAQVLSAQEMPKVAATYGHESARLVSYVTVPVRSLLYSLYRANS